MEFVFEKIFVPHKHSFIIRSLILGREPARIHSHKNFELNLITSGSGKRIVGNHISSFESGDLVLMGPDLPHGWEILHPGNDKPASCIVIHFYENLISSDFFNIPELEKVRQLLKQAENGIFFQGKLAEKAIKTLKKLVGVKGLESYIGLLKVFNLLLNNEEREYLSQTSFSSVSFAEGQERINKVYEYVFQNIQEGVSLQGAAELLNMAPGSFCRYFKKKTRLTFMQYVKNVRIGLAAKMLVETDKQITQICYDSGYNNPANFNHYFKSIMKKPPSEYRKSFR
ncbi:hypothetical protein MNBD_BACTEROID01-563 [hydrothermal vent metagenome]|uniref:HTH araC/xylS-type domain-containing protein n=1 Tax=hydrothermal vent metagenome TaxID=652676 RepID=A0A3B0TC71_9ZZZZ